MKKKLIAAVLAGAVMISGLSVSVMADKEKTFVYGTTGYSEEMGDAGLNPHDNYSGWSALRYGVGETLFKYNDNMEVEPWLATDYEFVDDTTVKITLRDGVKFSSGRTMDAQAVKECLENLVKVHDRAPSDMKIDHIEADGLTLTIYTTEPCPAIINYLGDPYGAIIDMEYGVQGEGGNANVAGTGPYIAEKVTPTQIDLVKNENYWGGDVKVDKVTVKSFSDGSALTAALQTGDIQGTYGLQYDNYVLFDGNPEYTINSCATSRCFFGQFNFESEIMQDQNIRKAIEMGIDKEGFCSVIMEGRGLPAKAAFPDSFSYGNEAVETVSYDPEEAKKLLEESGWKDTDGDGYADKDGQKLTIDWLTYPTRLEQPKLAEYAQATLKEIGIDVVVNNTSDHMTYAADGDFDVYVSSTTTAPTGDPEYFFTSTVVGPKNYGKYENKEVTALTERLHQAFEPEERAKLATELQQKILDDDGFFFVSHLNMGIVTKSNVKGMAAHPCDYYEITADLDVE
ncbi:MAG: ABC transporter substrate-binding protein [Blautia sp.]|uniref:ABC transporter substrate-binding protein n=1 Tax=Blautia sp. TaxID=1955243 RepID=UPI00257DEDA0|nr:ABC transporter substrate-binding protein [Blautia sp.]MBS5123695.1 ABC transporter substrate-binding protein [Blautia sp.]